MQETFAQMQKLRVVALVNSLKATTTKVDSTSATNLEMRYQRKMKIKSADNRILQEQLQNKCSENKELQERITLLEQQLAAARSEKPQPSSGHHGSEEYIDELRKKIQIQEAFGSPIPVEFDETGVVYY